MVAGLARVALGLSLFCHCLAQDRLVSEIPAEEQNALDTIVEDEYAPPAANRGGSDWESPVYSPLYSKPLPIPPVKQPLKSVTSPYFDNYYSVLIFTNHRLFLL
jgi:hypothetical protein